MTQEKLITQLCEVIKESEINAAEIFDKLQEVSFLVQDSSVKEEIQDSVQNIVADAMNLIQSQDLHRQKIERVVNFVCEQCGIDPSEYNIAPSAQMIDKLDNCDAVSADELEELIKQMT